jgi:hypothetical protein
LVASGRYQQEAGVTAQVLDLDAGRRRRAEPKLLLSLLCARFRSARPGDRLRTLAWAGRRVAHHAAAGRLDLVAGLAALDAVAAEAGVPQMQRQLVFRPIVHAHYGRAS